jgi:hypothetical protein
MQRRQGFAPLENYRYGHDNNVHLDICPNCFIPFEDEVLFFEHISNCNEIIDNANNYANDYEDEIPEEQDIPEEQPEEMPIIQEEEEEEEQYNRHMPNPEEEVEVAGGEVAVADQVEDADENMPDLEDIEPVNNQEVANIRNEIRVLQERIIINNNISNDDEKEILNLLNNYGHRLLDAQNYYHNLRNNLVRPRLDRQQAINRHNDQEYKEEEVVEEEEEVVEEEDNDYHEYRNYDCMICNLRFTSRATFENHFNVSHNNYSDLMRLTEISKPDFGFPGFEILIAINMIYNNMYRLKDIECHICTEEYYHVTQEEKTLPDKIKCDLDLIRKPKKYNNLNCDLLLNNKNNIVITDSYLKEYVEEKENKIVPYTMTCCDKTICNFCIKRQYRETGKLTCMYCNFDHTKYEQEYITIIEPHTYYNKKQWAGWWSNIVL